VESYESVKAEEKIQNEVNSCDNAILKRLRYERKMSSSKVERQDLSKTIQKLTRAQEHN